jgi:hypothetical protein
MPADRLPRVTEMEINARTFILFTKGLPSFTAARKVALTTG